MDEEGDEGQRRGKGLDHLGEESLKSLAGGPAVPLMLEPEAEMEKLEQLWPVNEGGDSFDDCDDDDEDDCDDEDDEEVLNHLDSSPPAATSARPGLEDPHRPQGQRRAPPTPTAMVSSRSLTMTSSQSSLSSASTCTTAELGLWGTTTTTSTSIATSTTAFNLPQRNHTIGSIVYDSAFYQKHSSSSSTPTSRVDSPSSSIGHLRSKSDRLRNATAGAFSYIKRKRKDPPESAAAPPTAVPLHHHLFWSRSPSLSRSKSALDVRFSAAAAAGDHGHRRLPEMREEGPAAAPTCEGLEGCHFKRQDEPPLPSTPLHQRSMSFREKRSWGSGAEGGALTKAEAAAAAAKGFLASSRRNSVSMRDLRIIPKLKKFETGDSGGSGWPPQIHHQHHDVGGGPWSLLKGYRSHQHHLKWASGVNQQDLARTGEDECGRCTAGASATSGSTPGSPVALGAAVTTGCPEFADGASASSLSIIASKASYAGFLHIKRSSGFKVYKRYWCMLVGGHLYICSKDSKQLKYKVNLANYRVDHLLHESAAVASVGGSNSGAAAVGHHHHSDRGPLVLNQQQNLLVKSKNFELALPSSNCLPSPLHQNHGSISCADCAQHQGLSGASSLSGGCSNNGSNSIVASSNRKPSDGLSYGGAVAPNRSKTVFAKSLGRIIFAANSVEEAEEWVARFRRALLAAGSSGYLVGPAGAGRAPVAAGSCSESGCDPRICSQTTQGLCCSSTCPPGDRIPASRTAASADDSTLTDRGWDSDSNDDGDEDFSAEENCVRYPGQGGIIGPRYHHPAGWTPSGSSGAQPGSKSGGVRLSLLNRKSLALTRRDSWHAPERGTNSSAHLRSSSKDHQNSA